MNVILVRSWAILGCGFVVLGPWLSSAHAQREAAVRNLGAHGALINGDWLAYSEWESFRGEDLNDGRGIRDSVVQVERLSTGQTTNLGQAGYPVALSGDWLVFHVLSVGLHLRRLSTGETTNLGLSGDAVFISEDWLVIFAQECWPCKDLNGDGDTEDSVVHLHDLATGKTTNLTIAVDERRLFRLSGDWLVFRVPEDLQGEDLNGDGDTGDLILHVHNLATGETTNLRLGTRDFALSGDLLVFTDGGIHMHNLSTGETSNLELAGSAPDFYPGDSFLLSGDWLVFRVPEDLQGEDLNGDGDSEDWVIHLLQLATGESTNLRLASPPGGACWGCVDFLRIRRSGDWLVLPVSEQAQSEDLNDDGDLEGWAFHVHNLSTGETTNLRLTTIGELFDTLVLSGDWLVFLEGNVVHVHNLSSGETANLGIEVFVFGEYVPRPGWLSGDWLLIGDVTQHGGYAVHNLSTGETRNLRLAGPVAALSGDWLVLSVPESQPEGGT